MQEHENIFMKKELMIGLTCEWMMQSWPWQWISQEAEDESPIE